MNQNGDQLDINLRSSQEEVGLLIFNMTGLGSPVATVNGIGGPSFDGVRVNSVKADARHMVLSLAIPGVGEAEEEARALIYEFFPVKQTIILGVKTANNDVYIQAIVESNDMNHFSKVVNAVISLFCPKPYFIDRSSREVTMNAISGIPGFYFPFSNESLISPLIIFGRVTSKPTASILYNSGVETGCDISIRFNGQVTAMTIGNSNGAQEMSLHLEHVETMLGSSVTSGDRLLINTRVGEKKIIFIRDGVQHSAIGVIGIEDDWIQMRPGRNLIVVNIDEGLELVEVDIKFNPLRDGI